MPASDSNDATRSSLTEQAYRELEERIVTLQLEPGAVLSEATVARQLGFGRTPVREALQRLSREGLVVIFPRRGVLVAEIDVKRQLALLEVRRELERLMARNAARRANERERKTFLAIARDMDQASVDNDDIEFLRLERELKVLMAAAGRNEFASRAMGLMHGLSRRFWYLHYREVADLPLCARLHADLARASGGRDAAAAAAASDRLMDYMEDFTRASLDATRSATTPYSPPRAES